jgi:hypothetical protein
MKRILLSFVITTFLINPLYSKNLNNRDCNEVASAVNSSIGGMQIDKITIFENAFCSSGANLTYNYKTTMDISSSEIFKKVIPELKTNNITVWCSDPDLSELIKVLDSVEFKYKNNKGTYLGKYTIDKSYCY